MCTAGAAQASGDAFGALGDRGFDSAPQAVAMADAAMDYLNAAVAGLDGSACGDLLIALGALQAKLTAAHAGLLRRFDPAGAHDADGTGRRRRGWPRGLACRRRARGPRSGRCARCGGRPLLDSALAAGDVTGSLAFTIADWTRKFPVPMHDQTDRIVLQAAAVGASLDDLAMLAACAIETWRAQQPDPGEPDPGDRYPQHGTTFGGAWVIRGDLTPECNAAVRAVLEALGKKAGQEDDRTEGQRFHDRSPPRPGRPPPSSTTQTAPTASPASPLRSVKPAACSRGPPTTHSPASRTISPAPDRAPSGQPARGQIEVALPAARRCQMKVVGGAKRS